MLHIIITHDMMLAMAIVDVSAMTAIRHYVSIGVTVAVIHMPYCRPLPHVITPPLPYITAILPLLVAAYYYYYYIYG